ncbi:MAG TPA: HEAT repeat domain-containing protein [Planctomycetota bacterium]|jgi:HEAT repeat protein|nr:HEAT repeat domain-containing protein [Planctomycetota bacterium]
MPSPRLARAACLLLALAASGDHDLADLEQELRAPKPETRRAAVQKLAALHERRAWDLVVGVLSDSDSMVADEAEVLLGASDDPKLARDLFGGAGLRARDAWVRLRAAEVLGRMPVELDAELFARALASVDANETDLRRMLLWSIERSARAKRLAGDRAKAWRSAEAIATSRADVELRCAALQAIATLDPIAAHPAVVEALSAREAPLRVAGLLASAESTEQECLTVSGRALEDAEPRVRVQAIENLEKLGSRAAILALVHQMEIETRERLRYGILAWLRARSGLDVGFDAAAWRGWAEKVDGRLATGGGAGDRLPPVGGTKASFAGMSLISDRVCFLVDFSGSTWQTKVGDRTRKEILDEKLRAALEALPAGTRFNVIPYTNDPIPWEKRLVASDKGSVKRALDFFERCHQSGRGNFYDAALLAIEDPDVDTLVVLTDGVPTGGHRWNLELMIELLVERNRYRKVAFDSVLVDAPKSKQKLWADLARRTGGRSTTTDLK